MVVAVTGASGFVGHHIAEYLEKEKFQKVKRITRADMGSLEGNIKTDWLDGVNTVVHTAAIAHSGHNLNDDMIQRIQQINSDGALKVADAASSKGVRRFVFISSAHVYGRSAEGLVNEEAELLPTNIYSATKMDAEIRLTELTAQTGMELIILRPPLIYGPGVKANFLSLIKLVAKNLPLPFAALNEQRSYCYVYNLADAVFQCLRRDDCWNEVYNVADAEPLSLADLCRKISNGLSYNAFLIYVPKWLIKGLLIILGKTHMIEALCKPLVLDTNSIRKTLHWQPPYTTEQGLAETTKWYKENYS